MQVVPSCHHAVQQVQQFFYLGSCSIPVHYNLAAVNRIADDWPHHTAAVAAVVPIFVM